MEVLLYVSFPFRSRLFKPLQKVGTLLSPILIKPLNNKLVGEGAKLQWPKPACYCYHANIQNKLKTSISHLFFLSKKVVELLLTILVWCLNE
jgi:hypothetical protein